MQALFSNLSLRTKMLSVVGLCIAALVGMSLFAVKQMNDIGREIETIAEQDMPLTNVVTQIATHQLEQTIYFERMLRFALEAETNPHAKDAYKNAVKKFTEHGHTVTEELHQGEKLAENAIGHAHTAEELKEFKHVLEALTAIEAEHDVFEAHVKEVIELFAKGNLTEGIAKGETIDAEADKLDRELEALALELAEFTEKAAKTAEAHEKSALVWLTAIASVATVLVGIIAWLMIQAFLTRPLRNVATAVAALTDGQTDIEVKVDYKDEIGDVTAGLEIFRQKLLENAEMSQANEAHQRQSVERATRLGQLNTEFDAEVSQVLQEVSAASEQLSDTATTMSSAAEETQVQSQAILGAADESSRNIQSVASSAEQLTASIQEIGRQTVESSNMSRKAVETAEGARTQVGELVANSQKIGDVVNLISDIAEQTNLLALNATIEAARAGEMGKGFAVVANEVKSLASQTAKATDEIGTQIETMQSMTSGTATAIEDIVSTINKVDEVIGTIASAMEEQNAATQEISHNVQQASAGAQEITSNVNGVSEAAGSTGQSAHFVLEATRNLSDQSDSLRQKIDSFLAAVRAA